MEEDKEFCAQYYYGKVDFESVSRAGIFREKMNVGQGES